MNVFLTAIKEVLGIAPVWLFMAHQDVVAKYRRTTLGPWWITLGTAIALLAMCTIWGAIFNMPLREIFPYITIGYVVWTFIANTLTEGANVFAAAGGILKIIRLPLLTFVCLQLLRNLYTFAHTIILCFIVLIIFQVKITFVSLLFIPGFLLVLITAFLTSTILGIIGARFRDIAYIINAFMTFIMLLTPVMWDVRILTGKKVYLAYLNPLTYYLSIVRDPLLNRVPPSLYYYNAVGIIIVLLLIASYLYKRFEKKIIFWL